MVARTTTVKRKKVVVIGAGGFGREVLDVIEAVNAVGPKWQVLGFLDDNPRLAGETYRGYRILGKVDWLGMHRTQAIEAIVAVGNNTTRRSIVRRVSEFGGKFCTIIHPAAILTPFVKIGDGVVITAGCILTNRITIGNHVILNLDVTVGHDSVLEDFVNLNPGVHINGSNLVGEGAYIGTGAVTIQDIAIGKWSIVGAGAVVVDNLPERVLAVGVPAKPIRELDAAPD